MNLNQAETGLFLFNFTKTKVGYIDFIIAFKDLL